MATTSGMTRQAVFAGLAFGIIMGAFFALSGRPLNAALVAGVGGAIFFGGFIAVFGKIATSSSKLELDGKAAGFEDGETVTHHGPANHFKGGEGVGGKLFLTNTRLRFRSHKININTHDESYLLADIASVAPTRTLGIVPNGLLVTMRDGRSERFVVLGRAEWVKRIEEAKAPSA